MDFKKEVSPKKEDLDFDLVIPAHVLRDRKLSALESIIEYLKEIRKLNYHEISVLLNRDERNIWTMYNRAKKKRLKNG
ncbi:MAG: hypothetical protein AABW41_05630 [Nanoarchaeota archaeon]